MSEQPPHYDPHDLEGLHQSTAGHAAVPLEEDGGTERAKDPGTNGKPTEAHLERWIYSVGTVTLPLLAGFSITSLVIVSDDAANFQWPGATILALAFAALALVVAVQCAYHAHIYLTKKGPGYEKAVYWTKRTRRFYDTGLFAVLLGLALVVVPHRATDIQAGFRWTAFGLACAACIGEVIWVVRDNWLSPRGASTWRAWRR